MGKLEIEEGLIVTPVTLDFTSEIHENFTQDIIQFLPIDELSNKIEDTVTFIQRAMTQIKDGTDIVWVILNKNQFVGCCGIHNIQTKQPHFGIWIKSDKQNQGIGKKVVNYILNWGISNLDVQYIKYPVDKKNTNSVSLIESLGLKRYDNYQTGNKKKLDTDEYRKYKDEIN